MPVTLRYNDGTAAVYASLDDALEQAAHDRELPYHQPAYVVDGDYSETHAQWSPEAQARVYQEWSRSIPRTPVPQAIVDVDPPEDVKVICSREQIASLPPHDCVECELRRRTAGWGPDTGYKRQALRQELETEHQWRIKHGVDKTLAELVPDE